MTRDHEHGPDSAKAIPVTNTVAGAVAGHVVQAGVVTGGVHLYAAPPTAPLPRQLPAAQSVFVGRGDEQERLTSALEETMAVGRTVVISAIVGTGGIGKTWLARHWANQHVDRFPDGQLFVDLRGFSPQGEPMPPGVAVRNFLDAFGVDPSRIPVEPDAQAALYRSLVAGKRMLIVLDNARDTAQVSSLLPHSPTCTVLITSRNRLAGLIAAHGARSLPLDVLGEDEARELLAARLGAGRIAHEPDAVDALLVHCGGFPLALSIVVGRAEAHPGFPLAVLATELRDASTRLGALDDGDACASLPAVLSWSYAALPAEQARAFGLVGIAPGADISLFATAALTGLPVSRVGPVIRALERASLLQQDSPGRYRMHDLVRLYAADEASRDLAADDRDAALRRLADFYTHTAFAGDRILHPHRQLIHLDPPVSGCHPGTLGDEAAALQWFDAEHPCLLATQRMAAERGWHRTAWELAWALTTFHYRQGHLHDDLSVSRTALDSAYHLGSFVRQSMAHRLLGLAYARMDRQEEALEHIEQALALAERAHDPSNQAHAHRYLAWAWERSGEDRRALEHAARALRLFRAIGDTIWEADGLGLMGWYSARLGNYAQARIHCEKALVLHRDRRNRASEADTLDTLGYIAHHTDDHLRALDHYGEALALYRDIGNPYEEADTLDRLGQTHLALGHHGQAHRAWQRALELFQAQHRIGESSRIRQQLAALDRRPEVAPSRSEGNTARDE
ncbi:tetratricopeptide repeat protein [Streptomyces sp. NBC_00133]|uniref:ATP-binding protein n=1 Tax=Streptomyces sp. NBC_00133 TaxID=2903624 RepID=UPI003249161D